MKHIEKKKPTRLKIAIVLAAALVVAVAASLIVYFATRGEGEKEKKELYPIVDGEDYYLNYPIAYPKMEQKDIQLITVSNANGKFDLLRPNKDGSFIMYYTDAQGARQAYYPSISNMEADFDYSQLYAIETGDGYNQVPKLTYLCMALQVTYFEERIELTYVEGDAAGEPLSAEDREKLLSNYGLAEGQYETVSFTYLDADGNEQAHTIKIGDATVSETGYYFMVDGRDYVYVGSSNYFDYALMGFYSFVNSILISPGLDDDTILSAYITSNYYQWVNEMHESAMRDENGASVPDLITDSARVVAFADVIVPEARDAEKRVEGGYLSDGYKTMELDLSSYKGQEDYARLVAALVGRTVGDYSTDEIVFTLNGDGLLLDFGSKKKLTYEYTIVAIESVITDEGETFAAGTPVGDAELVKLTYRLKVDGADVGDGALFHAVVDLGEEKLPAAFAEELRAARIGSVSEDEPIVFNVEYDKENSVARNFKYVVTEIVSIFDAKGKEIDAVTDDCIVCYRYRFMIDGKYTDEEYVSTLDLSADNSESGARLRAALLGKKVSKNLALTVEEYTEYCEFFSDFITYKVARIDYFVTKTLVSAFRFQNRSDRDPYYGDSFYENTMDNKYGIYGLNHSVCQTVVNLLAGQTDATSTPEGLRGTETVAVGLTPETMKKFGLYANTVYFELPRGLWAVDSGDENTVDDYAWYETLNFTLYISDEQSDGTRYVGSDLYDIVAKVDASKLVFLDYDFINFWARRDLMLVDTEYIDNATVELYMDDLKGIYDIKLNHKEIYIGTDGKTYTSLDKLPENTKLQASFDYITTVVTPDGECTPNKLLEYIEKMGYEKVSLSEFYNEEIGGGTAQYTRYDTLGTTNFKRFLETLYFTTYSGVVEAGEQAEIIENAPMVMRLSFKLSSSAWRYVYEFYRYDDRRVLVRLYQATYDEQTHEYVQKTTPVSDFYVSTFAFKKLADKYTQLMNAEIIEKEEAYES